MFNVLGLVAAVAILMWGVVDLAAAVMFATSYTDIDISGFGFSVAVAGTLVWVAYVFAKPDREGFCDHCGDPIRANSREDETQTYLTRYVKHAPKRVHVFGLSLVTLPRKYEAYYCSEECATEDPIDHESTAGSELHDRQPVDDVTVEAEASD